MLVRALSGFSPVAFLDAIFELGLLFRFVDGRVPGIRDVLALDSVAKQVAGTVLLLEHDVAGNLAWHRSGRTRHQMSGRTYSGRTSAIIDLSQDWEAQAWAAVSARHGDREPTQEPEPSASGFDKAKLDRYTVGLAIDYGQRYGDIGYLVIRGREQQLIDYHGALRARARSIPVAGVGAQSDTHPGEPLTENKIRAVARNNPVGELFHAAANLYFGELAPYTGERIISWVANDG